MVHCNNKFVKTVNKYLENNNHYVVHDKKVSFVTKWFFFVQKKDIVSEEYEQGYFNKKIGVNTNDRWSYKFKLDYQIDNREK